MYSIPLLLQYLFVIVVCCCVLYNMSQEDNVFMAIGLLGFAGCALANSFFNIFYITELTHQVRYSINVNNILILYILNIVCSRAKCNLFCQLGWHKYTFSKTNYFCSCSNAENHWYCHGWYDSSRSKCFHQGTYVHVFTYYSI